MREPSLMLVAIDLPDDPTNLVIHPAHPAYEQVKLEIVRPFSFDPRMFKR